MSVSRDFEELFACCNAREVKALVVGAYAVAFYGKPRFTKDLDLWIEPEPDNARRPLWTQKLAFLEEHEAIAVDASQRFALKKQIEEARAKVREHGGGSA